MTEKQKSGDGAGSTGTRSFSLRRVILKTIYKYPLTITDRQDVEMPTGSRLLSVGEQEGQLILWVAVDTNKPTISRCIVIVGTGNPAKNIVDSPFIGTVQMSNGLVWHVFDEGYPSENF